jgi:hypothetical protein
MKIKGRGEFLFGWVRARGGVRREVRGADRLEVGAL